MKMIEKIDRKITSYIRRKKNIRHAYDYPDIQDGWVKYKKPVLDRKWGTVFDPWVRIENNIFVMYVSERKIGSITRYTSKNGVDWENRTIILEGIKESWEELVNRPCCIKIGEKWYLWYTGQKNGKSCIGLAISYDGISFTRISQNPVLVPSGNIEKDAVMNPCVIYKNGTFRMWYATGESYEPDVLCLAESIDGIKWKKYDNNPVLSPSYFEFEKVKVGGCDIIENNNRLEMYYIGYQNIDTGRICKAVSYDDGYSWDRESSNPLISPTRGGWDAHSIYKPTVVKCLESGTLYLWYNGRYNQDEYIGLATKK